MFHEFVAHLKLHDLLKLLPSSGVMQYTSSLRSDRGAITTHEIIVDVNNVQRMVSWNRNAANDLRLLDVVTSERETSFATDELSVQVGSRFHRWSKQMSTTTAECSRRHIFFV